MNHKIIVVINIGDQFVATEVRTTMAYLSPWDIDKILDGYAKEYAIERERVKLHLQCSYVDVTSANELSK